jgi:hypothetical protein
MVSSNNRTRIVPPAIYFSGPASALRNTGGLLFPYQPDITYSQSANYSPYDLPHTNYTFHAYSNTPSPTLQLTAQFTNTTQEEHSYTMGVLHFLRSITKMFYGLGDVSNTPSAGTPPAVCKFYSYGRQMFDNVPVLIGGFSTTLDSNVDLIEYNGVALPAVMTIAMDLLVSVNPAKQKTRFSKNAFLRGNLYGDGFI